MVTAAIVAEYNPFHKGHRYLIQKARETGADRIIAVMSGAAVQRGGCAVFDKFFRAETAIKNGVDLVLELPCPFSCASGEIFASAAVEIVGALGENAVDRLYFGCESDNSTLIKQAAEASQALKSSDEVKRLLAQGKSYPLAVYEAACAEYGEAVGGLLKNPNSILAVEYAKAVSEKAPWIELMPVMRKAVGHHDSEVSGEYASATKLREMLMNGEDISGFVPDGALGRECFFTENMEKEILFRLSCAEREELVSLPDVSGELADRIMVTAKKMPKTLDEFLQSCKSKNVTMARLRRVVTYLALGVRKGDFQPVPYVRILAFNRRGREILADCKNASVPMGVSLKRLEDTSAYAARVSQLEQISVRFQYFCGERKTPFVSDYSRKIGIYKGD